MSMSIATHSMMSHPSPVAAFSGYGLGVEKSSPQGFLGLVWLAVALGVIAMFEPSPGDIGIGVVALAGVLWGKIHWQRALVLPFVLLALFVFSNLVSLCYAFDVNSGAIYFVTTLFMIVSWLFLTGVLGKHQERGLRAVMSAFTIAGVVSSLLAILAYFQIIPLGDWLLFFDRIKGFFKDPNVFGPYLVIVAVYALLRLQSAALSRKIVWAGVCLISTLGVLLSFSRAAWANYGVTIGVFFALDLFANKTKRSGRRVILVAVVMAILAGAVYYATTIPQVGEVVAYRSEIQSYDSDRFATHEAALRLGLDNPLGVGPGQSFRLLNYATHNLYLRVFSENGVIGFLALILFMLATLVRSLVLSQKAMTAFQRSIFCLVAAALVGALVNSFAIDTLHWRHLWLLLAIGWMPLWPVSQNSVCDRPANSPTAVGAHSGTEVCSTWTAPCQ
jgi:O-antigen ligase